MRAVIREKIEQAKDGPSLVAAEPQMFIEAAQLDKRIAAIMDQLPKKEWFTPKEVGTALGRCDAWVRDRFQGVAGCFNRGSGSKVYLAIPKDVLQSELRSMYRCRIPVVA